MARRRALSLFGLAVPGFLAACSHALDATETPLVVDAGKASGGRTGALPPVSTTTDQGGDVHADVASSWEARVAELESGGVYSGANPGPWAGLEAEHVPQLTLVGDKAAVFVDRDAGSTTAADAGAAHHVTTLYVRDQDGTIVGLQEFAPSDAVTATTFVLPAGTKAVVAFAHCDVHGTWTSADPGAAGDGGTSTPDADADGGVAKSQWEATAKLLEGPGLYSAADEGPWPGKAPKHVPSVQLASGAVMVTVAHEMRPASLGDGGTDGGGADDGGADGGADGAADGGSDGGDYAAPTAAHYIGAIYVRDQTGAIVGMKRFAPTDPLPAALFALPAGTTSITAYAWCNVHGAWKSLAITTG